MQARLMFIHALSPLHAGTGQGVGIIDLPIAREKATGLPYLPGSSLKGSLRSACNDPAECKNVFGPDTGSAHEHAGAVQIADQRLLLLPVRSLAGTFAWVTSPYVLRRFARDALDVGLTELPKVSDVADKTKAQICSTSVLTAHQDKIYLEDLDLAKDQTGDEWARWIGTNLFPTDNNWQTMLVERFCIVHDDILGFLLNTATEITARIRLQEDTKTVATGGLWYEEALPAETVLAGLVLATPNNGKAPPDQVFRVIQRLTGQPLQLGGKMTIGRGLCRVQMLKGA